MPLKPYTGFTLSELLIALAILGVIATFTIPKILQAQQDQRFNSVGKETIAAAVGATQNMILAGQMQANTTMGAMTPYLNIVKVDSSTTRFVDGWQNDTNVSYDCNAGAWYCLYLHNGAVIYYHPTMTFGGTGTTNAIYFLIDPDGKVTDGTTNGPGRSVVVYVYYNGMVRDAQTVQSYTTGWFGSSNTTGGTWGNVTPPWFTWN